MFVMIADAFLYLTSFLFGLQPLAPLNERQTTGGAGPHHHEREPPCLSWPVGSGLVVRITDALEDIFEAAWKDAPVPAKQWSGEEFSTYVAPVLELGGLSEAEVAALLDRSNIFRLHEMWSLTMRKQQKGERVNTCANVFYLHLLVAFLHNLFAYIYSIGR